MPDRLGIPDKGISQKRDKRLISHGVSLVVLIVLLIAFGCTFWFGGVRDLGWEVRSYPAMLDGDSWEATHADMTPYGVTYQSPKPTAGVSYYYATLEARPDTINPPLHLTRKLDHSIGMILGFIGFLFVLGCAFYVSYLMDGTQGEGRFGPIALGGVGGFAIIIVLSIALNNALNSHWGM